MCALVCVPRLTRSGDSTPRCKVSSCRVSDNPPPCHPASDLISAVLLLLCYHDSVSWRFFLPRFVGLLYSNRILVFCLLLRFWSSNSGCGLVLFASLRPILFFAIASLSFSAWFLFLLCFSCTNLTYRSGIVWICIACDHWKKY